MMAVFGRSLIVLGLLMALVGVGLILWQRFGLPRLPGDIVIRRPGFTLYFPLVTSLIAGIVLTLLLNLLFRRR